MEAKLSDSKILLPIGTEISLKMKGKNQMSSDVKLIVGDEDSKFFALFTENDVDFEIEINNRKCSYGIGYTLALNDSYYDYYVGPREIWIMEALYSNGRKLHFLSQNTPEGEQLVAETANLHNISYGEAAAICCKIEFTFEVEKEAEKPIPEPQAMGLSANLSEDYVADLCSIGTLGVQPKSLSLKKSKLFSSNLSNNKRMDALGGNSLNILRANSDMDCRSLGPDSIMCRRLAEVPQPQEPSITSLSAVEATNNAMFGQVHSLAKPFNTSAVPAVPVAAQPGGGGNAPESGGEDAVGEKGVICFGDASNQIYNAFSGFVKDKSLVIKPFVIEMRMSAKN
jgi:hypothetical protein